MNGTAPAALVVVVPAVVPVFVVPVDEPVPVAPRPEVVPVPAVVGLFTLALPVASGPSAEVEPLACVPATACCVCRLRTSTFVPFVVEVDVLVLVPVLLAVVLLVLVDAVFEGAGTAVELRIRLLLVPVAAVPADEVAAALVRADDVLTAVAA